jgi:hypothetical protein
LVEQASYCIFDGGEGIGGGQSQVSGIGEQGRLIEVDTGLGPHVGGVATEGFADERRGFGGPAQVGGIGVERDPEDRGRAGFCLGSGHFGSYLSALSAAPPVKAIDRKGREVFAKVAKKGP